MSELKLIKTIDSELIFVARMYRSRCGKNIFLYRFPPFFITCLNYLLFMKIVFVIFGYFKTS